MIDQSIAVPGEIAIKVCIGDVCLQWARLEMTLLNLICMIEPMELEQIYIIYGGLDILPRTNMAINLARHNRLPQALTKRIVNVRGKLQKDLMERRNQVVHGAHRFSEGTETVFTMVRWKGDKRHKKLCATDIAELAREIHDLGSEVWQIGLDLIPRPLRGHMKENFDDDFIGG